MKILFHLFLLLFFCFSSIQLSAINLYQNKDDKSFTDTLKNKIIPVQDSLSQIKPKTILTSIKLLPLLDKNFSNTILSKNTLEKIDYRTAADFFRNVPFGFVRDLGSIGQPNETLLYGFGLGNITFLSDGISINNRLSNSFDLNLLQSESVDSIEIIPLTQGFLYNGMNNPVSINFISREPNTRKPYSRIKYYQAPNSEGMIDGIFSLNPVSRLNAYVEITNQSTNPTYTNQNTKTLVGTDHSNWMGTFRLHYLLSDEINLLANYKYFSTNTQLFGGVDVDSIKSAYPSSPIESILYDKFRAPVKFYNRYQKVSGHNLNLRLLGNFIENSPTDFSFYYQTNLTEFRQNEDNNLLQENVANIFHDNESKTFGFNLRQNLKFDFLNFVSITNLERNTFNSSLLTRQTNKTHFSTTGIATIKLIDNILTPVIFAKYLNYSNDSFFGFGTNVFYAFNKSAKFYAGFSSFEKPRNIWEERFIVPGLQMNKQNISTIEISAEVENDFTKIALGYFNQTSKNALLSTMFTDIYFREQTIYFSLKDLQLQAVNLKLDLKIWKLLFSTNSTYYFSSQNRRDYKLPDFTSYGGIYYVDTLFNRNLKLKAGFNYSTVGECDYIGIDFERNISSYYSFNPSSQFTDIITPKIPSSFQLDFFLAGKIQNAAIIYFVFENLLNAKYFIVPFYPKQLRGLRFGIAWEFLD